MDVTSGAVLATDAVAFQGTGAGNWAMLNFSLTPSASTESVGITPGSDPTVDSGGTAPPTHICVKCGGQIAVGLLGAGAANLDFV